MIGLLAALAGALMIYIGAVSGAEDLGFDVPEGYADISLPQFIFGGLVISLPLFFLTRSPVWAWRYVILILMAVGLFNSDALSKFAADFGEFQNK
jgi:hypothetical protein